VVLRTWSWLLNRLISELSWQNGLWNNRGNPGIYKCDLWPRGGKFCFHLRMKISWGPFQMGDIGFYWHIGQ
jgi:hypothetical protein